MRQTPSLFISLIHKNDAAFFDRKEIEIHKASRYNDGGYFQHFHRKWDSKYADRTNESEEKGI